MSFITKNPLAPQNVTSATGATAGYVPFSFVGLGNQGNFDNMPRFSATLTQALLYIYPNILTSVPSGSNLLLTFDWQALLWWNTPGPGPKTYIQNMSPPPAPDFATPGSFSIIGYYIDVNGDKITGITGTANASGVISWVGSGLYASAIDSTSGGSVIQGTATTQQISINAHLVFITGTAGVETLSPDNIEWQVSWTDITGGQHMSRVAMLWRSDGQSAVLPIGCGDYIYAQWLICNPVFCLDCNNTQSPIIYDVAADEEVGVFNSDGEFFVTNNDPRYALARGEANTQTGVIAVQLPNPCTGVTPQYILRVNCNDYPALNAPNYCQYDLTVPTFSTNFVLEQLTINGQNYLPAPSATFTSMGTFITYLNTLGVGTFTNPSGNVVRSVNQPNLLNNMVFLIDATPPNQTVSFVQSACTAGTPIPGPTPPDGFTVAMSANSVTVAPGGSNTLTATYTRQAGCSGLPIVSEFNELYPNNQPAAPENAISVAATSHTGGTSTLTFTAGASVAPGSYQFTVVFNGCAVIGNEQTITFVVS